MLVERIVYSLLCIVLIGYTMWKSFKDKSGVCLILLGFQIISTLIQVLSLIKGAYPNYIMQTFIVIFAVLVPSLMFLSEYLSLDLVELFEIKTGDIHSKSGNYDKAIESYKKALEHNPKNSEIFVKLGKSYNAIGDRRTAFDRFAKAVELNRNDYNSYYEIGIIFNKLHQ